VNVAYEAATAELRDVNMLDHFHLDAYNEKAVNYNRDIDAFPLLQRIIERITEAPSFYKSPTDMGVNRAGYAITDDDAVKTASGQEIIRRYFRYSCEYAMGLCDRETVQRVELLMKDMGLNDIDREVVTHARNAAETAKEKGKGNKGIFSGAAIELPDGTIVKGYNTPLLHATSSVVLNAAKTLAGIPANIDLLPSYILTSLMNFKKEILQGAPVSLDLEETLIALAISATANLVLKLLCTNLKNLPAARYILPICRHRETPPVSGNSASIQQVILILHQKHFLSDDYSVKKQTLRDYLLHKQPFTSFLIISID
jgi:uncharacterized protein (UPF0371 family)